MELQPLIAASNPNLLSLLTVCLKHPQAPVRQSAYMLIDNIAMGCFVLLRPHMPGIMAELTLQLNPEPKYNFISASNNAAWSGSVGEVALRYGHDDPEFKQWSARERGDVDWADRADAPGAGRGAPARVCAGMVPGLYEIRDNEEKDSSLLWFCNAGVRRNQPSPELNEMFTALAGLQAT
ncbi:hypothetical protein C8J57DRAFT_1470741 [Mycena rebaudengoi]|nr:hypothetical protein C8J57DRAFT_1470741 [Mycena rebaudengoi]